MCCCIKYSDWYWRKGYVGEKEKGPRSTDDGPQQGGDK